MKTHGGTFILKENTEALINIFGTYVLYCFVEACRSFNLTGQTASVAISSINKQISSGVQDVLNPSNMFDYFLWIVKYNQYDDNEVMKYRRSGLDDRYLTSKYSLTEDDESFILNKNESEYTLDEKNNKTHAKNN